MKDSQVYLWTQPIPLPKTLAQNICRWNIFMAPPHLSVFICKWTTERERPKVNFCLSYNRILCHCIKTLRIFIRGTFTWESGTTGIGPSAVPRELCSMWWKGWQMTTTGHLGEAATWEGLKENAFKEILARMPDYRSERKTEQWNSWSSIIQPFASPHDASGGSHGN